MWRVKNWIGPILLFGPIFYCMVIFAPWGDRLPLAHPLSAAALRFFAATIVVGDTKYFEIIAAAVSALFVLGASVIALLAKSIPMPKSTSDPETLEVIDIFVKFRKAFASAWLFSISLPLIASFLLTLVAVTHKELPGAEFSFDVWGVGLVVGIAGVVIGLPLFSFVRGVNRIADRHSKDVEEIVFDERRLRSKVCLSGEIHQSEPDHPECTASEFLDYQLLKRKMDRMLARFRRLKAFFGEAKANSINKASWFVYATLAALLAMAIFPSSDVFFAAPLVTMGIGVIAFLSCCRNLGGGIDFAAAFYDVDDKSDPVEAAAISFDGGATSKSTADAGEEMLVFSSAGVPGTRTISFELRVTGAADILDAEGRLLTPLPTALRETATSSRRFHLVVHDLPVPCFGGKIGSLRHHGADVRVSWIGFVEGVKIPVGVFAGALRCGAHLTGAVNTAPEPELLLEHDL